MVAKGQSTPRKRSTAHKPSTPHDKPKFSFDDYDNVIGFLITQAAANLTRGFAKGLETSGVDLTPREFPILNRLHQYNSLTQSQISDLTYSDRPNITRMLDSLIARGLVQKNMDQRDRRAFLVMLTKAGLAARNKAVAVLTGILSEACADLSDEQIAQTTVTLRHIRDKSR